MSIDVFISYSRRDYIDSNGQILAGNYLSEIKKLFRDNGITYWFDEDGIYSGDEFASVITRAIRVCRVFLFVSSRNSNQSIWTSNEISTALELKKPIIPFRLDNTPYNDSVMMKVIALDYIMCDGSRDKVNGKLLRAVRHNLGIKDTTVKSTASADKPILVPKEDNAFDKMAETLRNNAKVIAGALAAVVLLAGAYFAYNAWQHKQEYNKMLVDKAAYDKLMSGLESPNAARRLVLLNSNKSEIIERIQYTLQQLSAADSIRSKYAETQYLSNFMPAASEKKAQLQSVVDSVVNICKKDAAHTLAIYSGEVYQNEIIQNYIDISVLDLSPEREEIENKWKKLKRK